MQKSVKKVVLLCNLGSPDSASVSDVSTYLTEFLMDERVIDFPTWLRSLLVKKIIIPKRAPKSAHAYASVWTPQGAPLIAISRMFRNQLQAKTSTPLFFAMRYGNPSIPDTMKTIYSAYPNVETVYCIPLYPHYAMSSYETVVEKVKQAFDQHLFKGSLDFHPPFYQDPDYISALVDTIRPVIEDSQGLPFEHLLFSYHGVPVRHLKKTDPTRQHCYKKSRCCEPVSIEPVSIENRQSVDSRTGCGDQTDRSNPKISKTAHEAHAVCYKHQVMVTTARVVAACGLNLDQYSISFQSRLGVDQWIEPFTDTHIISLAKQGVKHLHVVCPAFVSDCLETIEEIGVEAKQLFLEHGGESFTLIPCLNTTTAWQQTVLNWINPGPVSKG